MQKKNTLLRWFIPAVCIYAAGFLAATFCDLPLTAALYAPQNTFAILMESFGWYPAFLPPVFLGLLWCVRPHGSRVGLALRAVGGLAAGAILVLVYRSGLHHLAQREMLMDAGDPVFWLWIATLTVAAGALVLAAVRFTAPTRTKLLFFALVGCCYLVVDYAVIETLKLVWARPRFDDMLGTGSFAWFRSWYLPFGHGGTSFPSSHTAHAAAAFLLLVLCDLFPSWKNHHTLVLLVSWGYVAAMAFSRLVIGRHFLSDTLAASLLMALVIFAFRRASLYQKGLQITLQKAGATP